jgi:hypothetical protein
VTPGRLTRALLSSSLSGPVAGALALSSGPGAAFAANPGRCRALSD